VLVAFEGIDGSGKSTVMQLVASALRAQGLRVETTQEPTKTWLGEAVRRGIREAIDPLAMAFLFLADRALHVPELRKEGSIVLTDRYADSTTAYQAAALEGRVADPLQYLVKVQDELFPRPDLALLLDVNVDVALKRIQGRAQMEPFEQEQFLRRVRSNYLRLAKENRLVVVDAGGPAQSVADKIVPLIVARGKPTSSSKVAPR
jgi:dTMP kinase